MFHVKSVLAVCAVAAASGCAPMISAGMNASVDEALVRTETAQYFGVTESAISVENYEKHALATTWQTRHDGVLYNCRMYYGEVECKRPGA